MTPREQVLDIMTLAHSNNGLGIMYINTVLDDIVVEADKGNINARQFIAELTRVHKVLAASIPKEETT